jgi:hypothetical protein
MTNHLPNPSQQPQSLLEERLDTIHDMERRSGAEEGTWGGEDGGC